MGRWVGRGSWRRMRIKVTKCEAAGIVKYY
jgi:hypothetical protein